jgi:RNA polymerase sigma-70 factor (ECF subfamily)
MDTLPSLPSGVDDSPSPGELQRIFEVLSRRLSPKQRAAFVLREIEGIPTEEVSEILGMRQSTIRTHVQEARRILQEALRRSYPEYARGSEEKQR